MRLLPPRSRFEDHSGEPKQERRPVPGGHGQLRARFAELMRTLNRFEALEILTIAAVQGHCLGGGFELAARADVFFASEFEIMSRSHSVSTAIGSRDDLERLAVRLLQAAKPLPKAVRLLGVLLSSLQSSADDDEQQFAFQI